MGWILSVVTDFFWNYPSNIIDMGETNMPSKTDTELTDAVRDRYAKAARDAASGGVATCCGDDCGCTADPVTRDLYDTDDVADLPAQAIAASLGCGNPTALAQLEPGPPSIAPRTPFAARRFSRGRSGHEPHQRSPPKRRVADHHRRPELSPDWD